MKKLKVLFFLLTLSLYFTYVNLTNYTDHNNAIAYLQEKRNTMKCWKDEEMLSRSLLHDNKKTSINDFFMVPSARLLEEWPIDQSNVNDLFILMDIALSCKYSELSYSFLQQTETYLLRCKKRFEESEQIPSYKLELYKTCVRHVFKELQKIPEHISNMLFSLVDFSKYNMYIVSSKQDIMKIFLTWYLHLRRFENNKKDFPPVTEEELQNEIEEIGVDLQENVISKSENNKDLKRIENLIETMVVVGSQIKIALKEFNTQRCRSGLEFVEFSKYVTDQMENKDFSDILYLIRKTPYYLMSCVCSDLSVYGDVYDKSGRHQHLLNIIQLNKNISVKAKKFEWISIRTIFDKFIGNTKSLRTILKHDRFITGLMTKLVYAKVLSKVELYVSNKYNRDESIVETFGQFLSRLADLVNCPITFFNDMIELNSRLNFIIHNIENSKAIELYKQMKSAGQIHFNDGERWIMEEESNAGKGGPDLPDNSLGTFLKIFIINHIQSTYLNRYIMNVLCDKSCLLLSEQYQYAIDYKPIYTQWQSKFNQDHIMCQGISQAQDIVNLAFSVMLKCEKKSALMFDQSLQNKWSYAEELQQCLSKYNDHMENLKLKIIDIFSIAFKDSYYTDTDNQLRKLMLTVIFNIENVNLFNNLTQPYMDQDGVQNLKYFNYVVKVSLEKYHLLLVCEQSSKAVSNLSPSSAKTKAGNETRLMKYIDAKYSKNACATGTDYSSEIVGQCFDVIKNYTKFISENIDVFHGMQIKFRWNGRPKTAYEIQSELKNTAFSLQDLVTFQNVTVKWILFSVYTRFLIVVNAILCHNVERETFPSDSLIKELEYLASLSLDKFTSRPVVFIVNSFSFIVTYAVTAVELESFKNLLILELILLDAEEPSLPHVTVNNAREYVEDFCRDIERLRNTGFSSIIDVVGLKEILGGNQNVYINENEEFRITENERQKQ